MYTSIFISIPKVKGTVICERHLTINEDVCCSVVFVTLVGVFVVSVMWSELLMTSAISCPLWLSVYECHTVKCVFISLVRTECGMFVVCCMSVVL